MSLPRRILQSVGQVLVFALLLVTAPVWIIAIVVFLKRFDA